MNNFTKKELITLSLYMNDHVLNTQRKLPPSFYRLKNKLQSMIHNYCGHEFEQSDIETFEVHCIKCEERI